MGLATEPESVSIQRRPEPVLLKWKSTESRPEGDFYVRSGPGTIRLSPEDANEFVRTKLQPRLGSGGPGSRSGAEHLDRDRSDYKDRWCLPKGSAA